MPLQRESFRPRARIALLLLCLSIAAVTPHASANSPAYQPPTLE